MEQQVVKKRDKYLGLDSLPIDAILHILKWLEAKDLLVMGCVNKHFHKVASCDNLWKKLTDDFSLNHLKQSSKRSKVYRKEHYCNMRRWTKWPLKPLQLHNHRSKHLMPWLEMCAQDKITIMSQGSEIVSYLSKDLMDEKDIDKYVISSFKGHKDDIVRFVKHGNQIYSASMDKTVRVWSVGKRKSKCLSVLHGHHKGVYCIDADRNIIVSGSRDQTVKVWSNSHYSCLQTIPTYDYPKSLCIHRHKGQLLVGTTAHNTRHAALRAYDVNTGRYLTGMTSTGEDVERLGAGILQLKIDGPNTVFSCGYDTTVRLWDLRTKCHVRTWTDPHDSAVFCLDSNEGCLLLSGTNRYGVVRMWDKRMSGTVRSFFTASKRGGSPVYSLRFSKDGLFVGLSYGIQILKFQGDVLQQASTSPLRHGKKHAITKHLVKKASVENAAVKKQALQAKKSNLLPGEHGLQKEAMEVGKKKGTIRLSGPWHSDSGLDRNIDPQEDSYVKKVIASNEGLNFNKDMAEAGEVFDVNGIEDFYDKNALITYEVNGHEIPVHLKPKLTPQNQPMFPEYGHDSLSPPGLSDSRSNSASHSSQYNPGHKATTFFGMSLKDLPEYKVQDTPSVGDKPRPNRALFASQKFPDDSIINGDFASRHRLASTEQQQPPTDRLSAEYAQANSFGQEDVRIGKNLQQQDADPSAQAFAQQVMARVGRPGFNRMNPSDEKLSEAEEYFYKNRNKNYEHFVGLHDERNEHHDVDGRFSDHDIAEFNHQQHDRNSDEPLEPIDQSKLHSGLKEYYNSRPTQSFLNNNGALRPSDDVMVAGQNRGVGKEFDGDKLAPADIDLSKAQHEREPDQGEGRSKDKAEDASSSFFQQLEKIDEQRRRNEKDKGKEQEEKDKADSKLAEEEMTASDGTARQKGSGEKMKAKEKLLSILGDLTSKLKGMEAAVKDGHTDERRQEGPSSSSMYNTESGQDSAGHQHSSSDNNDESNGYAHHQRDHHSDVEEQPLTPVDHSSDNVNDHQQYQGYSANPGGSRGENADSSNSPDASNRAESSYHGANGPAQQQQSYEQPEQISHMINKFKQHERPFIFNTESIDYKGPAHGNFQGDEAMNGNDGKDRVNREPESARRPLIASFYRESPSDHYADLDNSPRAHSENAPSDDHSAAPTQRDNSGSKASASDVKDDESFDDKDASKQQEDNSKTNKAPGNAEADNKPEIDEDLPDYNEVKDAAIFEENLVRKRYHSDPLRWSDDLSDAAQKEADDLAGVKNLDLTKSKVPKAMNVALLPLNSLNVGKDSADMWQKESSKFDFMSPLITKKNTDFAQMVWKSSKEFGLGVAKTRDKENWIVVAKYDSPVVSEYEKLRSNLESDIPVPDPYSDIA
eukprot:gene5188-5842_t